MRSAALGEAEIRIDFAERADAVGVAEVMRVPLDALVMVGGEEVGLLDSAGQIDAALEDLVQPCSTGPPDPTPMKSGSRKSRAELEELSIDLCNRCSLLIRPFPRGEIDAEQFLKRVDLGQVALAQALLLFLCEIAEGLTASWQKSHKPASRLITPYAWLPCKPVHHAPRLGASLAYDP